MVYGPRAGLGTWLTVGVTAGSLCLPVVIVVAASGLAQPSTTITATEGIPKASAANGRLDAQLSSLPIVVTDFPDALSQAAASEYSTLRVQQRTSALTMFLDTWHSLKVDASGASAVNQYGDFLTSLPSESELGPDPRNAVSPAASRALGRLTSDPRNADRLNNAAVALFDLGVSWDLGLVTRQAGSPEYVQGTSFEVRALALLHALGGAFPPDRAALLNSAYLASVMPGGCGAPANLQTAVGAALEWLKVAPGDAVARLLVASLQARELSMATADMFSGQNGQTAPLADSLASADPLTQDNLTAGLGYATKGDAYLAAASAVAVQAPFQAHHYAEVARLDFEKALSAANDPGLWVGEAASLNILGNTSGALAAQLAAVSLAPNSAELWLGLALAKERVGDFQGMRSAAQQAFAISNASTGPLFRESRLVASNGDRGYLGYSFGSDRPRIPVYVFFAFGCGGGGFTTTTDVIPAVDDPRIDDAIHTMPLPDAAVLTAAAGALVLSDASAADTAVQQWKQVAASNSSAATDQLWLVRVLRIDAALQAVHLVADPSVRSVSDPTMGARFAESHLRHSANAAGLKSLFLRAAKFCQLEVDGQGPFRGLPSATRDQGLLCEGESAYHAGDYAAASAALQSSYGRSHFPEAGTEAAIATWKAGRPEEARHLLLKILAGQDPRDPTYLATREVLGEILMDQGDPRAAVDQFEETLNAMPSSPPGPVGQVVTLVAEHAYNNHGVALLWRAQSAPGQIPDCGQGTEVCRQARDDFGVAMSMDPSNPYYLQNAAWSDRLLNRLPVSKAELEAAAAADPSNFPVLNDLGVIAALSGDLVSAEHSFQSSLRVQQDYDLADWNLGVLGMQQGLYQIVTAQAYFARATKANPGLRGLPLQYQADNRIYRAAFGQPLQGLQKAGTIRGYSDAALTTGGIAALSALDDVTGVEIKARLTELLRDLRLPLFPVLIGRLRTWAPQRRLDFRVQLPTPLKTWLPTGAVLAVGTVWTVWSRQGVAGGAEVGLALLAIGIAVLVHECGHLIAACISRTRIAPAPSPLGIAMSVVLMPLRISSGPYAGHRPLPGTPTQRARWVYLAGPVANLLAAILAYALYVVQPLPFLLLVTGVQLAAAGFSLMPFKPLDGAALSESRKEHAALFSLLVAGLALVAGLGGGAIAAGRL